MPSIHIVRNQGNCHARFFGWPIWEIANTQITLIIQPEYMAGTLIDNKVQLHHVPKEVGCGAEIICVCENYGLINLWSHELLLPDSLISDLYATKDADVRQQVQY